MAVVIQQKQVDRRLKHVPYIETGWRLNLTATTFLRRGGNGDLLSVNPYRFPFDISIIAVEAQNRSADTDGWTAQVYLGGVVNGTLTTVVAAATNRNSTILTTPILVPAGTDIQTEAVITTAIQRPQVLLFYQRET